MVAEQGDEEDLVCALCPPSGPPVAPTNSLAPGQNDAQPQSDDQVDLQWIACQKCSKWYHTVCILESSPESASAVPQDLRDEAGKSGEGAWFDWASRVNKWYCKPCIDYSTSPENPRPPRNPLLATLKKTRAKATRSSGGGTSSPRKKARLSQRQEDDGKSSIDGAIGMNAVVILPPSEAHSPVSPPPEQERSRPKRRAALERPDYWNLHHHNETPTRQWLNLIKEPAKYGRVIRPDNFPRVPGRLLRKEWFDPPPNSPMPAGAHNGERNDFPPTLFYGPSREPMVVQPQNGGLSSMGGMVPDPGLTVQDVARLVGPDRMVDVIDVATQQSSQWPLSKWAAYVKARQDPKAASSSKVYNIISLEISGTELAKQVRPPQIVSDTDWVENFWPFPGGKEAAMRAAEAAGLDAGSVASDGGGVPSPRKSKKDWPKVQLYCLMGMKDSWTDWHVDFAASSVYYNVHTGSKVFFFIRPTEANLAAYGQWSGSSDLQSSTWLPDMCDEVRKVTLVAGDTMIIPAGYIHAVFTPVDSIVFGGNFVHSYDIATQLRLRQIEIDTKVPQRFRFPYFDKLCWHVAERYTSDLRQRRLYRPNAKPSDILLPNERVLGGLVILAKFLIDEVEAMEDSKTEEKQRRAIWNRIPAGVQDPGALAHELLWRVEQELPELWDEDEEEIKVATKGRRRRTNGSSKPVPPPEAHSRSLLNKPTISRTWKFNPSPWEIESEPRGDSAMNDILPRPGGEGNPEAAQINTSVHHQRRKRVRQENGETILEEQDVVFTEKRTTWFYDSKPIPGASEPPTTFGAPSSAEPTAAVDPSAPSTPA